MSNYVKSGIRNSYSSMMSSKFLDKTTGEFKQLKQIPEIELPKLLLKFIRLNLYFSKGSL